MLATPMRVSSSFFLPSSGFMEVCASVEMADRQSNQTREKESERVQVASDNVREFMEIIRQLVPGSWSLALVNMFSC